MQLQALVQTPHAVEEAVYSLVPELVQELLRAHSQILDFLQGAGTFSNDVPVLDQVLEVLWQPPKEFGLCRANRFGRGGLLIHTISKAAASAMSCAKLRLFQPLGRVTAARENLAALIIDGKHTRIIRRPGVQSLLMIRLVAQRCFTDIVPARRGRRAKERAGRGRVFPVAATLSSMGSIARGSGG